jgi:hypothetical protein
LGLVDGLARDQHTTTMVGGVELRRGGPGGRLTRFGRLADSRERSRARQHINEQIADPLDLDDNIALARLDVRIESLQEERRRYEAVLSKLLAAAEIGNKGLATELLSELDDRRDDFDRKIEVARSEMLRLAGAAIVGIRSYQQHVVQIGLVLLAIAGLLGITVAAVVTLGLVRPVRRLLADTAAVEGDDQAGPRVRIRLPPAVSLPNFGAMRSAPLSRSSFKRPR